MDENFTSKLSDTIDASHRSASDGTGCRFVMHDGRKKKSKSNEQKSSEAVEVSLYTEARELLDNNAETDEATTVGSPTGTDKPAANTTPADRGLDISI
jgi:hypothetical protein